MALANGSDEHRVGRISLFTPSVAIGLIGGLLALTVTALYSLFHLLKEALGVPNDAVHFFFGLMVVLVGMAGTFLAPILARLGAVLLVVAGIALFFVVGWWALIVSPFFLIAALLTPS